MATPNRSHAKKATPVAANAGPLAGATPRTSSQKKSSPPTPTPQRPQASSGGDAEGDALNAGLKLLKPLTPEARFRCAEYWGKRYGFMVQPQSTVEPQQQPGTAPQSGEGWNDKAPAAFAGSGATLSNTGAAAL